MKIFRLKSGGRNFRPDPVRPDCHLDNVLNVRNNSKMTFNRQSGGTGSGQKILPPDFKRKNFPPL